MQSKLIEGEVLIAMYNDGFLSKESTTIDKGIAALLIVLHHLSQKLNCSGPLVIMNYIGFIMVAVFFFISGYGLMYGLNKKENYLNNFNKKRILTILVPYWIVQLIVVVILAVKNKTFPPMKYLLTFFGVDMITGIWFVTTMLIFYLLFLQAFKFSKYFGFNESAPIVILCILITFYCIICCIGNISSHYTASASAFLLGIVWHKFEYKFIKFVREYYLFCLITILILFSTTFLGRLVLAKIGITNVVLHIMLRNIISILFVLTIITIKQKLLIKSRVYNWIGSISYEIYLTHFAMFQIISIFQLNKSYYYLATLICIPTSVLLKNISKKIFSITS